MKNKLCFQDLSTTDLSRELWLVAWVVRVGRWAGAGSSGSGTGERRGPVARRPLGAGVLSLAEFLRQPGQHPGEKEYTFKVSLPRYKGLYVLELQGWFLVKDRHMVYAGLQS